MNYKQSIQYLESFEKFGINLGLSRIQFMLSSLGNPERSFKTIHIAGTNGKGSVAAMLSAILSTKYTVGTYTSPHLHLYTERIRINEKDISKEEFASLLFKLKGVVDECKNVVGQPTIFEILTAMAFLKFMEEGVELSVIEVGLGGRLDATNVVKPLLSIITNIDYDHKEILGRSLSRIAFEKAGIIKEGTPILTAESKEDALKTIKKVAKEKNAPLHIVSNPESIIAGFKQPLFGDHQKINLALSLKAIEVLRNFGYRISKENIREGLKKVRWPGRFEMIKRKPLIILDGAHNEGGARALKRALVSFGIRRPFTLIIGIQRYKDIKGILRELAELPDLIILTKSSHREAADPELIAKIAKKLNIKPIVMPRLEKALSLGEAKSQMVVVTGSLFTVAGARNCLTSAHS